MPSDGHRLFRYQCENEWHSNFEYFSFMRHNTIQTRILKRLFYVKSALKPALCLSAGIRATLMVLQMFVRSTWRTGDGVLTSLMRMDGGSCGSGWLIGRLLVVARLQGNVSTEAVDTSTGIFYRLPVYQVFGEGIILGSDGGPATNATAAIREAQCKEKQEKKVILFNRTLPSDRTDRYDFIAMFFGHQTCKPFIDWQMIFRRI